MFCRRYFYNIRNFASNSPHHVAGFGEDGGRIPFLPRAATQRAARRAVPVRRQRSLTGIDSKAKGFLPPQKSVMSPEPKKKGTAITPRRPVGQSPDWGIRLSAPVSMATSHRGVLVSSGDAEGLFRVKGLTFSPCGLASHGKNAVFPFASGRAAAFAVVPRPRVPPFSTAKRSVTSCVMKNPSGGTFCDAWAQSLEIQHIS